MKKLIPLLALVCFFITAAHAQSDKSKRKSPADSVTTTTTDGITVSINYSKPSLKGRTIGVDVAELNKVWRTGANEATTISFDKDVTIDGKKLPAGKYSLYSIPAEQKSTVIFNKTWQQWGTKYDQAQDALRIEVNNGSSANSVEQLKIDVDKSGKVSLAWGLYTVSFTIKAAQ